MIERPRPLFDEHNVGRHIQNSFCKLSIIENFFLTNLVKILGEVSQM